MMKKLCKAGNLGLALFTICLFMAGTALADVSVYAEGAYTDTDLKVYIYADVTGDPLVSFGVKLTYNASEVSIPDSATCLQRNDAVWYFGDPNGTTYDLSSAAGPTVTEVTSPDQSSVVFVGGRIDSTETSQTGVPEGTRILLGIVTFARVDTSAVPTIGVDLGKPDPYQNFVELDGGLLDSTIGSLSAEIHERGDANGDGVLTSTDYFKIKNYIQNNVYSCFADCNDDGLLTSTDYFCLRTKISN